MTTRFEVEAKLTQGEREFIRAQMTARLKRRVEHPTATLHLALGFVTALIGAAIALALGLVRERNGGAIAALLILVYFAGIYAQSWVASRVQRRYLQVQLQSSPFYDAPLRFVIDERGVDVVGENAESFWHWAAFDDIAIVRGMLIVWAGSVQGIGIPIRAFADPTDVDRALDYARSRIKAVSQ